MLEIYFTISCFHLDGSGYTRKGVYSDYNENNPGVVVGYDSLITGGYKNSFGDLSFIAGRKFDWQKGGFEYGFIAGGVTGYEDFFPAIGEVTPFVAPYVAYDFNNVKPTILLLGSAVTLSVGFEF